MRIQTLGANVSDAEILAFVNANISNPDAIYNAMEQYGVSFADIMRAGNWTMADVQQYVAQSNHPGLQRWLSYLVAPNPGAVRTNQTASTAAQPRPSDADIVAFINDNINNPNAIYNAMNEYRVSFGDIMRAGNWTFDQVRQYVAQSNHPGLGAWLVQWAAQQGVSISNPVTTVVVQTTPVTGQPSVIVQSATPQATYSQAGAGNAPGVVQSGGGGGGGSMAPVSSGGGAPIEAGFPDTPIQTSLPASDGGGLAKIALAAVAAFALLK